MACASAMPAASHPHTVPVCLAAQESLCRIGTLIVLILERFQADLMLQETKFKPENSRVTQQMPDIPELICPA